MFFQIALFAFLILMLATAIMDLATMTIPNPLNAALLGLFLLFAVLMQVSPTQVMAALGGRSARPSGCRQPLCLWRHGGR